GGRADCRMPADARFLTGGARFVVSGTVGMALRALLCALIVSFVFAANARAAPINTGHVETELVSARAAIAPGERFTVVLRQAIAPGWHTYWRNPGDSGEAIGLAWTLPRGFSAG